MAECLTDWPTPLLISHMYTPSSPFLTWLRWSPPGSSSVLFGGIVPPDLCHVTCGGGSPTALHSSVTFEPVYNTHFIRGGTPHECLVIVLETEGATDCSCHSSKCTLQAPNSTCKVFSLVIKVFYFLY